MLEKSIGSRTGAVLGGVGGGVHGQAWLACGDRYSLPDLFAQTVSHVSRVCIFDLRRTHTAVEKNEKKTEPGEAPPCVVQLYLTIALAARSSCVLVVCVCWLGAARGGCAGSSGGAVPSCAARAVSLA